MITEISWKAPTADKVNHIWFTTIGSKLLMGDKTIDHGNVISISDEGAYYLVHFEQSAGREPLTISKTLENIIIKRKQ